jgi:hypothetical protein
MKDKFVVCIGNKGYEASLEKGKLYRTAQHEDKDPTGFIRVVDESGEDYLFPDKWFMPIAVPVAVKKALSA